MSFKSIFFTLFLTFGFIIGGDLSTASPKKIKDLEDINKMICQKEEIINCLVENARNAFEEIYKALKKEDAEGFGQEIVNFEHTVSACGLTKENITNLLAQDLFYANLNPNKDLVKRLKFILVRRKIEYFFLNKLLDSYNNILMELLD